MTSTTQTNQLPRIFKVGNTRIVEDDSTRIMSNEQMRDQLRRQFPEVANATISERTDGTHRIVEFLPQPGRKG